MKPTTIILFATLAGCAHEQLPPTPEHGEYRIGREDVVAVEVWKDPALSAKMPVRPDGKLSLPMVGDVVAAGRTASELQRDIAVKLKPYVEEPVVSVMVSEINAAKVFVLGEVAHPGAYPLKGALSVVQAVAVAGGPTEFASPRRIVLIRSQGDNKAVRYQVNLNRLIKGETAPVELTAGDTLFVP